MNINALQTARNFLEIFSRFYLYVSKKETNFATETETKTRAMT